MDISGIGSKEAQDLVEFMFMGLDRCLHHFKLLGCHFEPFSRLKGSNPDIFGIKSTRDYVIIQKEDSPSMTSSGLR
jgi:hypothetical protein